MIRFTFIPPLNGRLQTLNSYTCNIKVGLFQEKKKGGGVEMSHLDVLYEEHKNVFDIKLFTDKDFRELLCCGTFTGVGHCVAVIIITQSSLRASFAASSFTSNSRFHLRLPPSTRSSRGSHTAWVSLK